jgi:hypothetical protein
LLKLIQHANGAQHSTDKSITSSEPDQQKIAKKSLPQTQTKYDGG